MVPVGVRKYSFENTGKRVLDHLKKEKGNPQSISEIASALRLDENTVFHAINSIQRTTDLCQDKEGYYFPENRMVWWLAAFGLMIMCTYTVCEVIKYYHF